MIFNTNRTMSLGTIDVDVNESYFGAGALNFMQENAEIELELFEAAIKSDIDEVLIGESSYEIEALNEGFVKSAANKIKEIMKKFIEWLKAIIKSAYAKLSQITVKDNVKFCKIARAQLRKNDEIKYKGKLIKDNGTDIEKIKKQVDSLKMIWDKVKTSDDISELNKVKDEVESKKSSFKNIYSIEALEKEAFTEGEGGADLVERHIKFLESMAKDKLKKINKTCKEFEKFASKIASDAERDANKNDDESKKNKFSALSTIASAIKEIGQLTVSNQLSILKKEIKVARAVVASAMRGSKNEGVEYTDELVDAMIETTNYELDEALEEMSEGKECDPDDISDDDDDEE